MPRTCTVCAHGERAAIDEALAAGEPVHDLEKRYRLGTDDLTRHRATHLPPTPLGDPSPDPADELGSLARELARGYSELVESHRHAWGIGVAEAEAKAREHNEWAVEAVHRDPPDQLSWCTLSSATEHDPGAALAAWERVKDEARQELASGHRTAQSLEWGRTPWDRARYLAVREALMADWKPRGGVESALLDLLAQSFSAYLLWTERLTMYAETQCLSEDVKLQKHGHWAPPRMGEARWLGWCAGQAEAAHKRFLATLKMLHDLRRLPVVFVAGTGQVNVTTGPQLNVSTRSPGRHHRAGPDDLSKSSG